MPEPTVTTQATPQTVEATPKPPETPQAKADTSKSKDWAVQLSNVQKLNQERTALKAQQQAHADKLKIANDIEAAKATKNPAKILEAAGYPKEEVAKWLMSGEGVPGKSSPELDEVRAELAALKQEAEKFKQERVDKESTTKQAQDQAEATAYRTELIAQIETDAFPLVKANNLGPRVLGKIKDHHEKTGKWLEPEEAAKQVEAELAGALPAYLEKLYMNPQMRELTKAAIAKVEGASKPPETKPLVKQGARVKKPANNTRYEAPKAKETPASIWKAIKARTETKES